MKLPWTRRDKKRSCDVCDEPWTRHYQIGDIVYHRCREHARSIMYRTDPVHGQFEVRPDIERESR